MELLETRALGAAAARGRRDRRARGRRRGAPVPGGAVGAADHRALPGRAARPTRSRPTSASGRGSPTSSGSSPGRGCRSSSARSSTTTPALRRGAAREPAVAGGRARRARRRDRRRSPSCSARERLVEVVGPGGIGKTALAIATGRTLPASGGVWLVRLEAARTADEVLDAVIAALEVTGGEAALLERLRRAAAVVILDNCEHVVDAAAALAERLLDAAPGLRILCTSQVALERRRRGRVRARAARARGRGRAVHAARRTARRRRARCASCAGRSTACRWRSSSPRRGRGRCRSRRSRAGSTIASAC